MAIDLRKEIGWKIQPALEWRYTTDAILEIFNHWLREQDARNPDGDELRLDEIPPRTYHWVGRGSPGGGVIWRLERMRINKGVQTPPEREVKT